MLHPKAVELIEYAKQVGARVGLITNGSLSVKKIAGDFWKQRSI